MAFDDTTTFGNDTAWDIKHTWEQGLEAGGVEEANRRVRDWILDPTAMGLDIRDLRPSVQRFFDQFFIAYAALQLDAGVLEESVRQRAYDAIDGEKVDWDHVQQEERAEVLAKLRDRLIAAPVVGDGPQQFFPVRLIVDTQPGALGTYTAQLDTGGDYDERRVARFVPAGKTDPLAHMTREQLVTETSAGLSDAFGGVPNQYDRENDAKIIADRLLSRR